MRIERITSRDNSKLKHARAVRDGKVHDSIFIEGVRLCEEAVSSGLNIESVFVTDRFVRSAAFESFNSDDQLVLELSETLFGTIADTNSPQGIVMLASRPTPEEQLALERGISIFLYRINNPSNLGAVVRTAEAAGVGNILLSSRSADPYAPKALRSSMGSAFRMNIVEDYSMESMIDRAKNSGTKVVAVDAKGSSLDEVTDLFEPVIYIFGSEAHGLPDEVLQKVDTIVSIPMKEPVESLNLAVSCGIILYETRRRSIIEQAS